MTRITVNGKQLVVQADPATPLLWVLRDHLGLTGSKFGCGVGLCGACTVQIDGVALRSCQVPLDAVGSAKVMTVEGLSNSGDHPLQTAWIELNVPQCGYCQSGMLVAADALLAQTPHPTDADIDAAMTNICRCGTYLRVRAGIHMAAAAMAAKTKA